MSGAATTSGTTFQEDVATWLACMTLAESKAPSILGLAPGVWLEDVLAETTSPVDDLRCRTSAGGSVFFQCKTSFSYSEKDIAFASIIDQFIRQWSEGCVDSMGRPRAMDPERDRLVIAVGHSAPATVVNRLRELLNRLRSADANNLSGILEAISAGQLQDWQILKSVLSSHHERLFRRVPEETELLSLLRIMFVLPLDLQPDGADRRQADILLRQVLDEPIRSSEAWNLLLSAVRRFSPKRTGGNLAYFRTVVQSNGLIARPADRSKAAIAELKSRSNAYAKHLESYATISFGDAKVTIFRPIVDSLIALSGNDVLVVGTAGSGKSGCLSEFARRMQAAGNDVLVLAIDQLHADTIGDLDNELRLPPATSFVSVLSDWSGRDDAFLVIDALDAARTTHGLRLLCELIEQIRARAPRWKTVASIREFDLRHSRELQRLFRPASTADGSLLGKVRHVYVDLLTESELEQLADSCPQLARARIGCSLALQELTRNVFNLRLLAELVERSADTEKLSQIKTQVGLLDLYWTERIERLENAGMANAALERIASAMVARRTMSIETSAVDVPGTATDVWMNALGSEGIIHITEPVIAGSARSVSFAHNILFDYAVARLWLKDLNSQVVSRLADSQSQDLFLAIRPSVVMAFQRLWHASADRKHFWQRALEYAGNPGVRLFGKIIAANVAADEFKETSDILPVLEAVPGPSGDTAAQLILFMWQAGIAARERSPEDHKQWGENAPPWVGFAEMLIDAAPERFAWVVRTLLFQMLPK
jgi:hypothetical protein